MYRFIETERFEDKTVRTSGSTTRSLATLRHLPKVGEVRYVKGYIYRGKSNIYHTGVIVRGKLGSIRFGGFSWGYSGQGSRGLNQLFAKLGLVDLDATSKVFGDFPNWNFADLGEHWRVTFGENGETTLTTKAS